MVDFHNVSQFHAVKAELVWILCKKAITHKWYAQQKGMSIHVFVFLAGANANSFKKNTSGFKANG